MSKYFYFCCTLFAFIGFALNAQESPLSLPGDFPEITTIQNGPTAEGKVFLTVSRDLENIGFYIMVLENDGNPWYYKKLPYNYSYDFKRQVNGYYSYMEYLYPADGYRAMAKLMDPRFEMADSFVMTKGFVSDSHDFHILSNGHYILFGHDPYPMDLESYGRLSERCSSGAGNPGI